MVGIFEGSSLVLFGGEVLRGFHWHFCRVITGTIDVAIAAMLAGQRVVRPNETEEVNKKDKLASASSRSVTRARLRSDLPDLLCYVFVW